MKKILVISVLALFLALPVIAVTNWDFMADGNVTATLTLNGTDTNLIIKSGSKARSLTYNSNGTLDIVNAATSTFYIYPSAASTVNVIKIASSSTDAYTSCTTFTAAIAANSGSGILIASTTDAVATSTVSLISLSNAVTYNHFCGAATCNDGYGLSNATADADTTCTTCTVLTGATSYNGTTCGAKTCDTNYTLTGSGASATCVPPPGIIGGGPGGGSQPAACTSVVYGNWQTACLSGWQYRAVTSQSPSGCALTTAQDNDKKRTCTAPIAPENPASPNAAVEQINNIIAEAAIVATNDISNLVANVGAVRSGQAEANAASKYTTPLVSGLVGITDKVKTAITNFIAYGTPTTKFLGAGERAGVISSYKAAFNKVPATATEWSDVIKIGNGRWPSVTNATAEAKAALEFKKVYKRTPNMNRANDNAAVTVMSYGLRPANRNTNSEKAAIKSFKAIYGHAPVSAIAWDIVRAIAYSGATR